MGTRSGDLDPGVGAHVQNQEPLSADEFYELVNKKSGLLGVSGISCDMRELLKAESHDPHAKEAVDLFCYAASKAIGSLAAVLGGLDTFIFTGGIGENAKQIRERIFSNLAYLGAVTIRVIAADEALMIARATVRLI